MAVRGAQDGIWDWDLRTGKVYYSPRWKAILGYAEGEVGAGIDEWLARVHPEDLARLRSRLADHVEGRSQCFEDECRMRRKDGDYRWIQCRGSVVRDAGGQPLRMSGTHADVTDRSHHDPLTGVPTLGLFNERLEHALGRVHRSGGHCAVLLIDLDHFSDLNAAHGLPAGDRVLVAVARRLEGPLRPADVVGRVGGDKFAVVLSSVRSANDAMHVADRILAELRAPLLVEGRDLAPSARIGIALDAEGGAETLLRHAEHAAARAKQGGYPVLCSVPLVA